MKTRHRGGALGDEAAAAVLAVRVVTNPNGMKTTRTTHAAVKFTGTIISSHRFSRTYAGKATKKKSSNIQHSAVWAGGPGCEAAEPTTR
jgi:hypothetical protein